MASPTAGLHFTPELLSALEAPGSASRACCLHVGPGHVSAGDGERSREARDGRGVVRAARRRRPRCSARRAIAGGRIVAVGTTSVRALESACDAHGGVLQAASGWTRKFIVPPYRFQAVDALLTNFHLPRTTLLLLVAAFAGEDLLRRAYAHAVAERYRFYSYGDAMLVV